MNSAEPLVWWAAAVVLIVVSTAWLLVRAARRGADSTFWTAFGGGALLLPAVLVPAATQPAAGALLSGVALAAAAAAAAVLLLGDRASRSRRRRARNGARRLAVESVHDELLGRWMAYELDPARQIDFPAMSDVRRPETAAMIKAIRRAADLRAADDSAAYGAALTGLRSALGDAERAAGVYESRG
ncbi:hypothetical protein KIH31_11935 [Paenarthrobacter sp. DKR-5]|uniref:hypothetical protein n=1 Tax=Paenarthrobacter sp. DKR-5 TaxID=2835535 RepID=UPI001BDC5986|nr:hypothetical protein [Paenarthrobacter sp. DKR-5]MBT1003314.1 hypothetical protein [Paenarthrobacter sp. DKR-5]